MTNPTHTPKISENFRKSHVTGGLSELALDVVTEGQILIFFFFFFFPTLIQCPVSLWLHPCSFWFSMSTTSKNFQKSQVTDDLSERSSSDRDVTGHTPFELIEMVQYFFFFSYVFPTLLLLAPLASHLVSAYSSQAVTLIFLVRSSGAATCMHCRCLSLPQQPPAVGLCLPNLPHCSCAATKDH